ncbi:astacin [Oesophagostomum dentatum]|uniref:Zinc metalloproteinase n=1 Tax=Oesophagostomum dentatum TaxID=61180 RepID=A0A0B1SZK6_OESDE|nr:astacin [Oesophagostomum dentatum]
MKTFYLLLLLAMYANGGLLDRSIKTALDKIHASLNKHRLLSIREKMHSLKSKVLAKIALSPEKKAVLEEKLQKMTKIKKNHVNVKGDSINEINERSDISELLFQGDIVLTDVQAEELIQDAEGKRVKRQAFRDGGYPRTTWEKGVFYSFHNASNKVKSVFTKAAQEWEKDTCIDFIESDGPERIEVMIEDGCWSYVGNTHKKQPLSLGDGCESVGTAAHEIGHALGMFHTHSRHDRDDFIMLNAKNIQPGWEDQFDKETKKTNDNYNITYDYGSVMHYGATRFALFYEFVRRLCLTAKVLEFSATYNDEYTMVPYDENYIETLGSPFISFYELLMINKHYNCLGESPGGICRKNGHDRDDFIMLNAKNIQPGWEDQFDKETKKTNDNYGITYDYGSVMHYGATSATYNDEYTMVPYDENYIETLGSPFISFYELLMINKHYNCLGKCKKTPQCKNDGFPHPRDCSKCICPSGYGGDLCDKKPSGCGAVLQATNTHKTLKDVIGDERNTEEREDFEKCHYWIEAPAGKKIEIKIVSFSEGHAVDGCVYAGVEIKTNKDQRLTGYRFCAPEDAGKTLVSSSNRVPVITYNRAYVSETILKYRAGKPNLTKQYKKLAAMI